MLRKLRSSWRNLGEVEETLGKFEELRGCSGIFGNVRGSRGYFGKFRGRLKTSPQLEKLRGNFENFRKTSEKME